MSQKTGFLELRFLVFTQKCFPPDLYVVEKQKNNRVWFFKWQISGKQSLCFSENEKHEKQENTKNSRGGNNQKLKKWFFLLRSTVRFTHVSWFCDFVTQGRAATPDWSSWPLLDRFFRFLFFRHKNRLKPVTPSIVKFWKSAPGRISFSNQKQCMRSFSCAWQLPSRAGTRFRR